MKAEPENNSSSATNQSQGIRQLDKFQIIKEIDAGGMAEIYIAKQKGLEGFEKLVVIKKLLPKMASNPQVVKMFLDEARIAAQLNHPNIVQIFDLGHAENDYYIAMEFIHGENLGIIARTCRKNNRPVPLHYALKIISQACEGLYYAHTKTDNAGTALKIVHCDISPQNILVSFEGVVKLVDFGIAKAKTQIHRSTSKKVKGKLAYMSPEQCLAKSLDARSDLFSLGIVLWELVTGRRLFGSLAPAVAVKAITRAAIPGPSRINKQLPSGIDEIVCKALEKNPDERYQNAYEMYIALESFGQKHGLTLNTFNLGAFMKNLFPAKLVSLRRLEQYQFSGKTLESFLFDDLLLKDTTATSSGSVEIAPVTDPSLPLVLDPESKLLLAEKELDYRRRFQSKIGLIKGLWVASILALVVLIGLGMYSLFPDAFDVFSTKMQNEQALAVVETGMVRVTSNPSEAEVTLDGEIQGKTPYVIDEVQPKTVHVLEVNAPDHKPWSIQFRLKTPGEVKLFHASLEKIHVEVVGEVQVVTDPPGARIELNGNILDGFTPRTMKKLAANQTHKLKVSMHGKEDWITSFVLQPNQKLVLKANLTAAKQVEKSKPKAVLYLDCEPAAEVYLGSILLGRTPLVNQEITAGDHKVKLVSPAEHGWVKELNLHAEEGEIVNKKMVYEKGLLVVEADPWGEVFMQGKKIGATPLKIRLYEGEYTLQVKNNVMGIVQTHSVSVKPEKEHVLRIDFFQ